jgi:hypothetical protein
MACLITFLCKVFAVGYFILYANMHVETILLHTQIHWWTDKGRA